MKGNTSKLTEEDITEYLKSINRHNDKKFREWFNERLDPSGKRIDAKTCNLIYSIKEHIDSDKDFIQLIIAEEGQGKTICGLQLANFYDPVGFDCTSIVYNIQDIARLMKEITEDKINNKQGKKVIVIDEGNEVLFSRSAMSSSSKLLVRFFALCRQLNLYIIICIPNLWTADKYIVQHRVKSLIHITARGKFTCYNSKYIKMIAKVGAVDKNINKVRVPRDGFYKGYYSKTLPSYFDYDKYLELKHNHMKNFVQQLNDFADSVDINKKDESEWVSLTNAKKILPIHREKMIEMVNNNELDGKKMGGKWFIRRSSLLNPKGSK